MNAATDLDIARELLASLDAAGSAQDLEAFTRHFVDGPDTLLAIEGELIEGLANIRQMHREAWSGLGSLLFFTTPRSVVRLAADALLVTATGRSERGTADGQRRSGRYAMSLLLVRRSEGWRVSQVHESIAPAGSA